MLKLHIFSGLPDPSGTLRLQARVSVLYARGGIMKKIIRKGDRARRQRVSKPQRFNSNRVSLVRSSAAGEPGELARITGEREEALTQQTATSELLAIISSGVAELGRVDGFNPESCCRDT